MTFVHLSVLGEESPEALVGNPSGLYVDGTFGRGGHARRILSKLSDDGRLIAFDRDPEAVRAAAEITDPRFTIVHAPFSTMQEALAERGVTAVDGIFLDIGVSSPQIDDAERGFSFRFDGPLDMRMDTTTGPTAAEWLETRSEEDIARVLSVVPRNRKDANQHPATRTFQAVRIAVNGELDELRAALCAAGALLKPEGRLAVITFHSLEDRIVKHFFDEASHPEKKLDPRLPIRAEDLPQPTFVDIRRIRPSEEECSANPRARSAILRVGTRTAQPWSETTP